MHDTSDRPWTGWALGLGLLAGLGLLGGGDARAQTGPGGVGTTDGTSDLKLWLRAEELSLSSGSSVGTWPDASGYDNDATQSASSNQPTFDASGGPNSGPAVVFDPSEGAEYLDGSLSKTDAVTLVGVYRHRSGTVANGTILEVHDGGAATSGTRNIIQARASASTLGYYDGSSTLTGGTYTGGAPLIHTAIHEGASVDMFKNGASVLSVDDADGNASASSYRVGDDLTDPNTVDGAATAIIAFSTSLNSAERTIVENYLSTTYGVGLASGDRYSYDGTYGNDLAGIGRATPSAEHLSSNSDVLNFEVGGSVGASGFGQDDQYVFVGHDGGAQEDFSTASFSEPVNGLSAEARRIGRTWRADLTFGNGSGPKSVTISVDADSLPSPPDAGDSYFILVDNGSSSFDDAPEAYELTGSGTLSTTVELADGDHIAVAAGQRTVRVATASATQREDLAAAASPKTLSVRLNLPYTSSSNSEVDGVGTDVTLNFDDTGDLDGSGVLEDDGVTNAAGANGSGVYEADDGSGNDTAGSFDGDYRVTTRSPITIGAGSSTAAISYEIDDDGITAGGEGEQTERFEIRLTGTANGNASVGTAGTFRFAIADDDDPRRLSFDAPSQSISEGSGGSSRVLTFQIDLASDAATTAPLTSVDVTAVEAQTDVTFGDVSSDVTADVEIVDESGDPLDSDGRQSRKSSTAAEVTFNDGANTTTATFKLRINEDGLDEADPETAVFDLATPTSAALASSGTRLTVTISDDDSAPTVQFKRAGQSNAEDTDGTVEVTLSNASGSEVTVDFGVDSGASSAQGGGEDFSIGTSSPLVFPPGTTSQTIAINVSDDAKNELEEAVALALSNPSSATLGGTTTHTYSIRDNDPSLVGTTGPGGVGATDGSGQLTLWLRADAITGVSDGNDLSTWPDTSGNDNDAGLTGGNAPEYSAAGGPNGGPEVRFDASNDEWMEGSASKSGPVTLYAVYRHQSGTVDFGTVLELEGSTRNILQARPPDDDVAYYDGTSTLQDGNYGSGENIIHGATHAGTDVSIYKNGGPAVFSTSTAEENASTSTFFLGNDRSDGNEIDGAASEALAFSASLNDARRTLIENYLAAKYDIALTDGDEYAGDQSSKGDYDRGVFGIGRESTDAFHTTAEADGLRFALVDGLDENGDYLLAGHRVAANAATTADVNGLSGALEARSTRTWYTDVTNAGAEITVDVTVDLSAAGLSGPAGAAGNYVLLRRPADAADGTSWTAVQAGADGIAGGDEIAFNDVSLVDGTEITLGTTDAEASPLVAKELVVTGTTSSADGRDQGWRYMGLPVTGGTAGDLHRADGSNVIDFRVDMAYTNPGGDVQGSGGGWTAVEDSTVALPSGRGFILWLYDDANYPLAPSLTLTVPSRLTAPGQDDVTVGDGTPAADPSLARSDRQFLLANPYAVPFGLGSLKGTGFDDLVQVWEPNATNPSGIDDGNAGSFVTRSRSSNDRLAAWQGFLATRSSTGSGDTELTFDSDGRAPSATPGFVGSKSPAQAPTQHRVPLRLVGRDADSTLVALDRAASVLFRAGATTGRDRYDAPKLEPMASTYAALAPVASEADSALRAQESRPLPKGRTARVPLSVQTKGVEGTFTIRIPEGGPPATETPSIPDDWTVQLVDRVEGTTHELTPGGDGYGFDAGGRKAAAPTAAAAPDSGTTSVPRPSLRRLTLPSPDESNTRKAGEGTSGGATPRFVVEVRPAGALPVELADLQARRTGRRAVVEWRTAAETGNAGFQVQHQRLPAGDTTAAPSTAAWTTLGFVEGQGTTSATQSYRYETSGLDYGRHLFRLKQVDVDGTSTTTEPVAVEMQLRTSHAVEAPYPNPARERATLPVTVRSTQQVTVAVFDLLGRRVRAAHRQEIRGQQTKRISLPVRDLASGAYFVRVRGETFSTTRRLTVVR